MVPVGHIQLEMSWQCGTDHLIDVSYFPLLVVTISGKDNSSILMLVTRLGVSLTAIYGRLWEHGYARQSQLSAEKCGQIKVTLGANDGLRAVIYQL
jgi:hypothetical protein